MKKLRGSTLQFAILVSVIIFIILSLFLLLTYTFSRLNSHSSEVISSIYKAEENVVSYVNSVPGEKNETENIERSYWGSYEKILGKSSSKGKKFKRAALVGTEIASEMPSLYLVDQSMPLVLAGNTKIQGEVYLPGAYVKPGSVGGEYFIGSTLIEGKIHKSADRLPELNRSWLSFIDSLYQQKPSMKSIPEKGSLQNSFLEKEKVYAMTEEFIDFELKGNIIVLSRYPITIRRSASIDQVMIVAPGITVESGFNGSFHAITSNFRSGSGSYFNYPSSVTTITESDTQEKHHITIAEGSRFEGNLICLSANNSSKISKGIFIHKNSEIMGMVYSESDIELYGTIEGSLYANRFITEWKGSTYLNHVFDSTIANNELPVTFSGALLQGTDKTIAAWLY